MKDSKMKTSSQKRQPATYEERMRERAYQAVLERELRANTKLYMPPSTHIAAWRSYERAMFGFLGRNPHPSLMGYNLQHDTTSALQWAHDVLTRPAFLKSTGFTKTTAPRRALAMMARAYGYRYLRGLEAIEHGLGSADLGLFKQERRAFREDFITRADAAHAVNSKGENPALVLELVLMFAAELKALVPWLELAGKHQEAAMLLEAAQGIGARGHYDDE